MGKNRAQSDIVRPLLAGDIGLPRFPSEIIVRVSPVPRGSSLQELFRALSNQAWVAGEAQPVTRVVAKSPLLVIAGLHGFAVAAPLFETLSENPEFLVAHHLTPLDVLILAVVLCFGLPAVFFLVQTAAHAIHRVAGLVIRLVVVGTLAALLVSRLSASLFDAPTWVVAVLAGLLGSVTAVLTIRSRGFASFLRFVWPSGLVFAAVFLLKPAVRDVWTAPTQPQEALGSVQATTPIVLVVFDELPLATLLDEQGGINSARFKNFAALSRESSWFSNATTVAEMTDYAVPAILTPELCTAGAAEEG